MKNWQPLDFLSLAIGAIWVIAMVLSFARLYDMPPELYYLVSAVIGALGGHRILKNGNGKSNGH